MMNRSIELHDSELYAVMQVGTQVIVILSAYLHQSEGEPGRDKGIGGWQSVALVFKDGASDISGEPLDLPLDIWSGKIERNGQLEENMIPLPFSGEGEIILRLHLEGDYRVTFRGCQGELVLIGQPDFIEEFPGYE